MANSRTAVVRRAVLAAIVVALAAVLVAIVFPDAAEAAAALAFLIAILCAAFASRWDELSQGSGRRPRSRWAQATAEREAALEAVRDRPHRQHQPQHEPTGV